MAKIYGTPIMAGGSGGANKDLPPLLDNFKAKIVVDDEAGTLPSSDTNIELSANKMEASRANELAGAVWVYGDHSPANVNDGTKIQLTREECIYIPPDFPPEPTEYSEIEKIYNSEEWSAPESGYFKIIALAKSGDGGNALHSPEGYNYGGGSGGSGGICVSVFQLSKGEKANITINGDISIICKSETMDAKQGNRGGDASEGAPGSYFDGSGGNAGTASGGNLENKNGQKGNNGTSGSGTTGDVSESSSVNNSYEQYQTVSGNGAGVVDDKPKTPGTGTAAYVVVLRGNTNIPSQRETSTNPDTVVQKSIPWSKTKDFYARQFTYNSKKQYQTMLEGAIATLVLTGVPDPVTELAETHSSSSITLTWKNPTSDELYNHTVVVYKTDAFPTTIDDGTQGYTGTDETATLSDLELGTTYYIAVFTVSDIGVYGQPETIQVEIPAGKLLSSLASGTKVKLGKWNNTDLQWKIARDTSDQSIRLVLEPTSVSLLGNMQYDNAEPSNSDSNRRRYGNSRYIYSNIHQWLNATKASEWYTAQHSADAAPAYASSPGFLSGWSENHINALDNATLTTSRSSVDGGGTETFVARVALISTTELGLQNSTGGGRLDIFNSDGDRATGSYYWTRTPYPSHSSVAYPVAGTGGLDNDYFVNVAHRVRPLCIPVSTALVSLEMDDDGCYVVQ